MLEKRPQTEMTMMKTEIKTMATKVAQEA